MNSTSQGSPAVSRFEQVAENVDCVIDSHRGFGLAIYTLAFYGLCIFHSARVQLTFDEFLTEYIIKFHSLPELWNWLKTGVELNPPLFHVITKMSVAIFGTNPIGLRLPAMIGFWVMTVCIWIFLRRRTNALVATIGMVLPLFTIAFVYGFQARPYGIVLGCTGMLLVSWQTASESRNRKLALAGIFLSMAIAVSCHYYAVLLMVPIALGELKRSSSNRKIDWGVWAALISGCAVVLLYLPLIRSGLSVHRNEHVYNRPEASFPIDSYSILIGDFWPIALVAIAIAIFNAIRHRDQTSQDRLRGYELLAVACLTLLPFIGYAAAVTVTNMISDRYVIPMITGAALIVAVSLFEMVNRDRRFLLVLIVTMVFGFGVNEWYRLKLEKSVYGGFSNAELDAILQSKDVAIAVKPVYWLPFDFYAPAEEKSRAFCLMNPVKQREFGTQDTPETLVTVGQGVLKVPLTDYSTFIASHNQFFIFGGPVTWLEADVVKRGGSVKIVYQSPATIVLFADLTKPPKVPTTEAISRQ